MQTAEIAAIGIQTGTKNTWPPRHGMRGVHQVVLGLVILAGSPKQAEPQVDDREARGGNEHHEQVCWPAAWQHPYNGQPDEAENAGHGDEDAK
ncbi:MAG: hypothetical protein ACJAV2_003812, partial [Myxococcota bacterium]